MGKCFSSYTHINIKTLPNVEIVKKVRVKETTVSYGLDSYPEIENAEEERKSGRKWTKNGGQRKLIFDLVRKNPTDTLTWIAEKLSK